jgi:hypothetical protein
MPVRRDRGYHDAWGTMSKTVAGSPARTESGPILVPHRHPRHGHPARRQRFMAQGAGARTVEITASHISLISRPAAVTALIVAAAHTVR